MTVSKIRLNGTDHDIRAKYLIQSSSADATSAEFSARTVTEDAVANIQKIYGNTVVVSDNLVSNSATAILSRGFNQWDEEWLLDNGKIVSKNFCPCAGDTVYYLKCASYTSRYYLQIQWYDSAKAFISSEYRAGQTATSPSSARWFKIATQSSNYVYGTTYNHDICINISDTSKNGTYEPYNGHQVDLNIPTLTGKLNGAGSSVVIFPDGMNRAGATYDELTATNAVKRKKIVNLGSLTWTDSGAGYFQTLDITDFARPARNQDAATNTINSKGYTVVSAINIASNDKSIAFWSTATRVGIRDTSYSTESDFTTAMDGVYLVYDLATPEEYTLDNALQFQYPVVAGGTEMVLPTTGTAPMKMDVIYGNAADAAATMSQNFISVDSMKEFLAALGTQMGGTWSMGYENGKHTFTFTTS